MPLNQKAADKSLVLQVVPLAVLFQWQPWLSVITIGPLTLLILLAGWLGQGLPALPTYLEAPACSQPCWHDLHPGVSTLEDVLQTVDGSLLTAPESLQEQAGRGFTSPGVSWETRYFPSYDVQARFRGDLLVRLDLYVDGLVLLGDLFAVFGEPSHAMLCPQIATSLNYRRAVSATLYFGQGTVEVAAFDPDSGDWLIEPGMRVARITYHTLFSDSETRVPSTVARWHGFGRTGYSGPCS